MESRDTHSTPSWQENAVTSKSEGKERNGKHLSWEKLRKKKRSINGCSLFYHTLPLHQKRARPAVSWDLHPGVWSCAPSKQRQPRCASRGPGDLPRTAPTRTIKRLSWKMTAQSGGMLTTDPLPRGVGWCNIHARNGFCPPCSAQERLLQSCLVLRKSIPGNTATRPLPAW